MELHEFHVLQRQAGPQHHGVTVASADMCRCAREVCPSIAASGKDRHIGSEAMNRAVIHVQRDYATATALVHDEVDSTISHVELRPEAARPPVHALQIARPPA